MEQIHFSLDTEPLPQPRPRFHGGRTYQPARIIQYKEKIRRAASEAMEGRPPLSAPLKMMLRLGRTSRRRVDVDNLSKAVLDAVNGVAYQDDSLIFELTTSKYFTDKPLVEVAIEEIA